MKKAIFMSLIFVLQITGLMASVHLINGKSQLPNDPKKLYLDLMKKILLNTIYEDPGVTPGYHVDPKPKANGFNSQSRELGVDWPSQSHTMIGIYRLNNIQECLESVLQRNIPGDCIETGVWRGGATILMRAVLKAYNVTDRKVWVADSFEGLPPPNVEKYPADQGLNFNIIPFLAISLEQVQKNFDKYGLLDDQVIFLKGFFKDTLPTAPIEKIALLRLDGDLYESTMDALIHLYPKLSVGGFIIIDDFESIAPCKQAVIEYRVAYNIQDPIIPIDRDGVYWQKTK